MKKFISLSLVLLAITFSSCHKTHGCTDMSATNFDASADVNSGCTFSTVTFYGQYTSYNGIPISRVDVAVDGVSLGNLTSVYPSGPGNCSAPGTLPYTFTNNKSIDWNSTVTLASGQIIYGSGTIAPTTETCMKVNVTQ